MKLLVVLCVTLALEEREVEGWAASPNPYAQLDYLLMGYDKRVRPGGRNPLPVEVSGYVIQMNSNTKDLQEEWKMEVMMYLRQFWRDERLADMKETVILTDISNLWHPDVFFVNEIKSVNPAEPENFVRVSPGGEVLWSQRLTKKIACNELKEIDIAANYCGNSQCQQGQIENKMNSCTFSLESYGWSSKDMVLSIREGPGQSFKADTNRVVISPTGYFDVRIKDIDAKSKESSFLTGNYTHIDVVVSLDILG